MDEQNSAPETEARPEEEMLLNINVNFIVNNERLTVRWEAVMSDELSNGSSHVSPEYPTPEEAAEDFINILAIIMLDA